MGRCRGVAPKRQEPLAIVASGKCVCSRRRNPHSSGDDVPLWFPCFACNPPAECGRHLVGLGAATALRLGLPRDAPCEPPGCTEPIPGGAEPRQDAGERSRAGLELSDVLKEGDPLDQVGLGLCAFFKGI